MGKMQEYYNGKINTLTERKKRIESILIFNERMNKANSYEELEKLAKEFKKIEPSFELNRYLKVKKYNNAQFNYGV